MLKITNKFFCFIIALFVCSCSLGPGTYISPSTNPNKNLFMNPLSDYNFNARGVNFIKITPDMINDLNNKNLNNQQEESLILDNYDDYEYKVGIGDVLNITVWDHPELTIPAGQFRSPGETGNVVHADGSIFYPYIGRIPVVGLDVIRIRDLITKDLSKYIEAPQVDVSIAAFKSQRVFVSGSVLQPSILQITDVPLTLLDAIHLSGGINNDANWHSIILTSSIGKTIKSEVIDAYSLYYEGDLSQNRLLKANDVIHVPNNDELKVFVMGDLVKPETQIIRKSGLTLAEAINNAGGLDEKSADASGIFVLRKSSTANKIVDIYQLDASYGPMMILSTQFALKPMDIVYVTSAPVARWNNIIQQLLPSFNSLYRLDKVSN